MHNKDGRRKTVHEVVFKVREQHDTKFAFRVWGAFHLQIARIQKHGSHAVWRGPPQHAEIHFGSINARCIKRQSLCIRDVPATCLLYKVSLSNHRRHKDKDPRIDYALQTDPNVLGLVRDSYPQEIARNASEHTEWPDLPKEACIPLDFDGLFDWAKLQEITYSADSTRKWEVVHIPRSLEDEPSIGRTPLRRVTVRLFGVIGNLNLMDLGNWDRYLWLSICTTPGLLIIFSIFPSSYRTETGAAKAMQFLSLRAGPFQHEFDIQQATLANLRRMIFRLLGEHEPSNNYKTDEMFLHRRVFSKVCELSISSEIS